MTPLNNDVWEVKDSECMVKEFEYYFYSPNPDNYTIEGSHAMINTYVPAEEKK